jgi:hypothetical protein
VMPAPSVAPSLAPIPQTLPSQQPAALTEARAPARSEVLAQNQIVAVSRHMATAGTQVPPERNAKEML